MICIQSNICMTSKSLTTPFCAAFSSIWSCVRSYYNTNDDISDNVIVDNDFAIVIHDEMNLGHISMTLYNIL